MKRFALVVLLAAFAGTPAVAQQSAPEIPFESVPRPLKYSPDMNLGEVLGVALNSEGHIVILNHPGSANTGPIWMNSTTQLLDAARHRRGRHPRRDEHPQVRSDGRSDP